MRITTATTTTPVAGILTRRNLLLVLPHHPLIGNNAIVGPRAMTAVAVTATLVVPGLEKMAAKASMSTNAIAGLTIAIMALTAAAATDVLVPCPEEMEMVVPQDVVPSCLEKVVAANTITTTTVIVGPRAMTTLAATEALVP